MKQLILLITYICIVVAGCRDEYGDAMKRLTAEQKQLDWIDTKMESIKQKAEKEIGEMDAKIDKILKSSMEVARYPELRELNKDSGDEVRRITDRIISLSKWEESNLAPWYAKRKEQMQRVEAARKAVDDAK